MKAELMKTEAQKEREARESAVYRDYTELMAVQGQSKTMVVEFLMKKHNVHTRMTIYNIIKRVENRIKEGQA